MKKINFAFLLIICFFFLLSNNSTGQITPNLTSQNNTICNGVGCNYEGPTILINEVVINPSHMDGSIYGCLPPAAPPPPDKCRGEWIELYNPDACKSVDISCYFLGNNSPDQYAPGEVDNFPGGYLIPEGTIIPPLGFFILRGTEAPAVPAGLIYHPVTNPTGKVVEAIVNDPARVCIGGGSRLWFPNHSGWFAFYDNNGVPQDAIQWNPNGQMSPTAFWPACTACQPCNPGTPGACTYSGSLPSYNAIPANRKHNFGTVGSYVDEWASIRDLAFRRTPDGGAWAPGVGTPSYAACNSTCATPPVITCNGTATANPSGGNLPYTYLWDDGQAQTTQTAIGLCEGNYCVTIRDNSGTTATACVYVPNLTLDVTAGAAPDEMCAGETIFLNSTAGGGQASYSFSWTGPGFSSANQNPSITNAQPSNSGTYNVTATDQNTCTGTANVVVNVYDNPDATITPVGPFCDNDPAVTLTAATSGGTWSGTGITNPSTGTFDPSQANIGNNVITYNVGSGMCADSDQTTIVVNATPVVNVTQQGALCADDSAVTLSATPAGGTWSGTGVNASGVFTPSSANIGENIITYEVTIDGCSDSDQISIHVIETADATITPVLPLCEDDPAVTLTAATPGGTWSGNGVSGNTFDPAIAGPGSHNITYNVGTGDCADSDAITIVVNAIPVVEITQQDPLCADDPAVTLSATPTGGTWSGTGVSGTGLFTPSDANIGDNIITYEVTVDGCTNSDQIIIVIMESADATITPVGPFCVYDPEVTITAATPGGTWSGNGITNQSAGTFNPGAAGAGNHNITYSVGSGGCADTDQIVITVYPIPVVNITQAGPFCFDDPAANLSAMPLGGTWSGTGVSGTGLFTPSNADIGNNIITYEVTVDGCTNSAQTTIVIMETADATITPVGPFCVYDPQIALSAVTPGGTWSGPGITSPNIFHPSIAGAGNHTITYTVGSGGCADSDQITITVYPTPIIDITPAGPFCITDPIVNLSATPAGGTWSGQGITNAGTGTFNPAMAGLGNHNITYQATIDGCSNSGQRPIQVFDTPDATITPVGPFCEDDPAITLSAVSPGGTWSGQGITNQNTGVFSPIIAGEGSHIITYNVGAGDCSDSDQIIIVVNPIPNATITPVGQFCEDDAPVDLNAVTQGGIWSGPGIINSYIGTFDPSIAGIGTHIITYAVNIDGCTDISQITIIVTGPTADFSAMPWEANIFNAHIDFQDMSQGSIIIWGWEFGDGAMSNEQHPKHTYQNHGVFPVTLTVYDHNSCKDTITKYITIFEPHTVYFPTAINIYASVNNAFYPKGVGIDKENYELFIYSRWGEVLFYTQNFDDKWYGRFRNNKGDFVPNGVYVYLAKITDMQGMSYTYSGTVTVLK